MNSISKLGETITTSEDSLASILFSEELIFADEIAINFKVIGFEDVIVLVGGISRFLEFDALGLS